MAALSADEVSRVPLDPYQRDRRALSLGPAKRMEVCKRVGLSLKAHDSNRKGPSRAII